MKILNNGIGWKGKESTALEAFDDVFADSRKFFKTCVGKWITQAQVET